MSSLKMIDGDGKETDIVEGETPQDADPAVIRLLEQIRPGREGKKSSNFSDVLSRLELASPEPASDRGNSRFFPKGALLFELMSRRMDQLMVERFGASRVRTPAILNWKRPDIQGQAGMFNDQLYHVQAPGESESEFVLRFNGDVGQFAMLSSADIRESQLPFRLYEMAECFRYLSRGTVSGIGRGRSFTLPDMHSFCSGREQALQEHIDLSSELQVLSKELETSLTLLFKVPEGNYEAMKPAMVEIVRRSGRSGLIRVSPVQTQYWCMKHISFTDGGAPMFHVQLDYENGERYGVYYQDKEGVRRPCSVVHTAIGSVEGWLLNFIAKALESEFPQLPIWLSPTQVRILPINNGTHTAAATRLAAQLNGLGIRADVDDYHQGLRTKIAESGREWVPYTVVFGDTEHAGGTLSVRSRDGTRCAMTFDTLVDQVLLEQRGMPFLPLAVQRLSKRITFKE